MVKVHVIEQRPDSLFIKADALSQLAFLNLATSCSIYNHQFSKCENFYFHDSFEKRKDYFELTDELNRLSKQSELLSILPFSTMHTVEFNIARRYLATFIKKLNHTHLIELQELAAQLNSTSGLNLTMQRPISQQKNFFNINYNPTEVSLLDIDRSIENKIIFYHLYQANKDEVEKIIEKIDLMTMEQKENFIEQIFQISPLQKLPRIIYNQIFCTLKITAPFSEINPIGLNLNIRVALQNPVHYLGYHLPEEIKNTNLHEPYLSLMEKIKIYYEQTQNPYVLPGTFNQQALLALDLQSVEELSKIETPLKDKIFQQLIKYEPFLKTLIRQ